MPRFEKIVSKENQLITKGEPFEINKFEKERERLFLLFKNFIDFKGFYRW